MRYLHGSDAPDAFDASRCVPHACVMASTPLPSGVLSQTRLATLSRTPNRRLATVAIMSALVVTALDGTAISGALPVVVRELGGIELYPWVFTASLAATAMSVPIAGKLADSRGRLPVISVGMAIFVLGSMLGALSTSMGWLVFARVVQGLGVGAVAPLIPTLSGDLYSLEERAKVQALFTAAWGGASAAGPLLGGWVVLHTSWRWVFALTAPFALLSVVLLWRSYRDPPRATSIGFDPSGAIEAAAACGLALLALDRRLPISWPIRALIALGALVAAALSATAVRRGGTAVIEPDHLRDPVIRDGLIGSFFVGAIVAAPTAFVPLWMVQDRGLDAISAASFLIPLLGGWAFGSTFGVRAQLRWGGPAVAAVGMLTSAFGTLLLVAMLLHGSSSPSIVLALTLVGVGLGPCANALLLGSQARVAWSGRGTITGAIHASRTLGGALAIALLAALTPASACRPLSMASLVFLVTLAALGAIWLTLAAHHRRSIPS
jgi:MFS family permease